MRLRPPLPLPLRLLVLLLLLLPAATACRGAGGTGAGGGGAKIDAQCVLVPDGGICTFRNSGGPGARCVKILLGASTGTVVASEPLCSGRLGRDGQMTVVVKFASRPGDLCGTNLADCQTRVAEPDVATAEAATWSAELKTHYTGPATEQDCRALVKHRYDLYVKEDCGTYGNPQEKQDCTDELYRERDQDMRYQLEDCMQYAPRAQINCQMQANSTSEWDDCSDKYPSN